MTKKMMAGLGVWVLGAALWCSAQEMGLLMHTPNTVYLAGEPIVADVRIHNRTTRAFVVRKGLADSQLTLRITRGDEQDSIDPFDPQAVMVEMTLGSTDVWEGRMEITRFFPVRDPGRYLVRLVTVHDGTRYESSPRAFDVVTGLELAKVAQVFPGQPPLQRKMRLVYWVRNQMEELFLEVKDEPATRFWRTYSLGPVLRTTAPTVDISPDGMLSIVHRVTPDVFVKTQIKSEETAVTFLGQEKLLDPVTSTSRRMLPFQKMAMDDALDQREKAKQKGGWWRFW
jgi:hypothetical protein